MSEIKRVIAPVRVDFGGGTTDIYPFTHTHGGCVVNAAIDRYVIGKLVATNIGTHLEYTGNIPTSSGLGTSSAMNAVWLALISHIKNRDELAEGVFKIEQSISGLVGGKQDGYAAVYGGINFMEFKKNKVHVHRLKLRKSFFEELENNLVLVYSGKSHYSGSSNGAMIKNLIKGKNIEDFLRIKDIAIRMKKALLRSNLSLFAELMNEETVARRKLSKVTVSPILQKIIDRGMGNGAIAAKVCGSGGGGSILFLAEDKRKLVNEFKNNVIDFKFDMQGLRFIK